MIDHLRARGFRDGTEGVSLPPSTFSHVLWSGDGFEAPCSAQVLCGARDARLQLAFGTHYPAADREKVRRTLERLVRELFAVSDLETPSAPLTDLFAVHGDRALTRGLLSLDVVYPEPEPGQDFEHVAVGVSRALEPGEWEAWVDAGLFAAADAAQQVARAACRTILHRHDHPLADARLTHVMGLDGDGERMDLFTIDAGGSVQVRMLPDGPAVTVIGPDGTLVELR